MHKDTASEQDIVNLSKDEQNQLTFQLSQILENWKLEDGDQLTVLGLEEVLKPRHLYLYRRGDKSFEFNDEMVKRTRMILGIHESLGTTFPTNREYASVWLKRSVKKFKHKTPLELMLSGDTGMNRVWHFLDCTQGWRS
ncbi:antitoxin Xre/MbcA/ParS toxin-binding domain-containing protein [Candidatus Thioglobus sp.]|jgi:hypothetical protein|uniref:antitoxin Xre/MbcA/ParS toxin-binding domain-containing protein n=1 Tax=Candidatus Thioglobus sp. TaxID=2026721 RepID=UPI001D839073|nr:antitoxin Xre/MbcA/ParS toxin-binding domain-containing protein [Candidatus Thioglobus sp.]MBT3276579.1 DUF2384 domain-containing protein [Candidatus Thioglobus sp.]MBT3446690.1 DUF2384 domain-containing protein [Candidatus Thioglobus sp.]MBT3745325.1 DUF2384 domain-containing protein [Candidatus Thioglobus sp.]MBT4001336.1 DUF2384 domain-containing protein [Candidatus Thioglobus sp.]MBT4182026.1 DUF2384 domain-containing protein [Candidatus Thioglobus sp.]